jgi:short-chain fatty acids transporter
MNMISRLDRFFTRYYPDPIVFTIVLTLVTLGVCVIVTDISPSGVLDLWGDGLPGLLTFMGQLSLTLVFSHTLANTDIVSTGLKGLSRLPRSARQAYLLVVLITCGLSLITWSLGLVGGAIIARTVAQEAGTKGVKLNYPLLVAAAYAAT